MCLVGRNRLSRKDFQLVFGVCVCVSSSNFALRKLIRVFHTKHAGLHNKYNLCVLPSCSVLLPLPLLLYSRFFFFSQCFECIMLWLCFCVLLCCRVWYITLSSLVMAWHGMVRHSFGILVYMEYIYYDGGINMCA